MNHKASDDARTFPAFCQYYGQIGIGLRPAVSGAFKQFRKSDKNLKGLKVDDHTEALFKDIAVSIDYRRLLEKKDEADGSPTFSRLVNNWNKIDKDTGFPQGDRSKALAVFYFLSYFIEKSNGERDTAYFDMITEFMEKWKEQGTSTQNAEDPIDNIPTGQPHGPPTRSKTPLNKQPSHVSKEDAFSKDAGNVIGLAFENELLLPAKPEFCSISVNSHKQEPQWDGRLDVYTDVWIEKIYDPSQYALAFKSVRIDLECEQHEDFEIQYNLEYEGKEIAKEDAVIKQAGTGELKHWLVSASKEDGILNDTYRVREEPLFSVVPKNLNNRYLCSINMILSAQLYDSNVVYEDDAKIPTNNQAAILAILLQKRIDTGELKNGRADFARQNLKIALVTNEEN